MHIALTHAVAGDDAALASARAADRGAGRRGPLSLRRLRPRGRARLRRLRHRDYPAAIAALEPIAGELERIGGSHAQLDLVRFTLLQAYLGADRPDDARRLVRQRRPHGAGVPVAGLAAAH